MMILVEQQNVKTVKCRLLLLLGFLFEDLIFKRIRKFLDHAIETFKQIAKNFPKSLKYPKKLQKIESWTLVRMFLLIMQFRGNF